MGPKAKQSITMSGRKKGFPLIQSQLHLHGCGKHENTSPSHSYLDSRYVAHQPEALLPIGFKDGMLMGNSVGLQLNEIAKLCVLASTTLYMGL